MDSDSAGHILQRRGPGGLKHIEIRCLAMFEKHRHKEQVLKDMSQKQEINRFSDESQKILDDMNHTEIFELCENSAKHQCPDCNAFLRYSSGVGRKTSRTI